MLAQLLGQGRVKGEISEKDAKFSIHTTHIVFKRWEHIPNKEEIAQMKSHVVSFWDKMYLFYDNFAY